MQKSPQSRKQELDTRWKSIEDLSAKVDEESGFNARKDQLAAINAKLTKPMGSPDFGNLDPRAAGGGEIKSTGQQFVESKDFKEWLDVVAPEGSEVNAKMRIESPSFETKSLIMTSPATAGGAFVRRDYGPWPVQLPPPSVDDSGRDHDLADRIKPDRIRARHCVDSRRCDHA